LEFYLHLVNIICELQFIKINNSFTFFCFFLFPSLLLSFFLPFFISSSFRLFLTRSFPVILSLPPSSRLQEAGDTGWLTGEAAPVRRGDAGRARQLRLQERGGSGEADWLLVARWRGSWGGSDMAAGVVRRSRLRAAATALGLLRSRYYLHLLWFDSHNVNGERRAAAWGLLRRGSGPRAAVVASGTFILHARIKRRHRPG
jgi:hypothetical protein